MRPKIYAILMGTAFLCAAAALAEWFCRRQDGPPKPLVNESWIRYAYLDIYRPFFKRQGGPDGLMAADREGAKPVSFPSRKPAGTCRIFVIGGSVAELYPVDQLSGTLERCLPGRKFEVIDCGVGAYDSYREGRIAQEVLNDHPDILILMSGNNEFHQPEFLPHPSLYRAVLFLRRSKLFELFSDKTRLLSSRIGFPAEEPLPLEERNRHFESNLRRMVRSAKERGVATVLCTMPLNSRIAPQARWEPLRQGPLHHEAWEAFDEGDYPRAVQLFQQSVRLHPDDSLGYFGLASALEKSNRGDEAELNYKKAMDCDNPGERCSPRKNAIIRNVAREEGAILADLDRAFVRLAPQGAKNQDLFEDHVHWLRCYYPFVSIQIAQAMSQWKPPLFPDSRWDWAWFPAEEGNILHPRPDRLTRESYARGPLLAGVMHVLNALLGHRSEMAISLFMTALRRDPAAFQDFFKSPDAVLEMLSVRPTLRERAAEIKEHWPDLLLCVGEARRRSRLDGAARRKV